MAKLEVFGTEAKGLRWDSGTRQDYVPVPPELAAEIERLQRCADALEIAETAVVQAALKRLCTLYDDPEWPTWKAPWPSLCSHTDCREIAALARDALTAIDAAKNPEAQR